MKKIIKVLCTLCFLLLISFSKDNVQAALASNELIKINKSNGQSFVVTKDTTIEQIMEEYGNIIRVQTDSVFGGQAYTFYTDDNYSNFLYVETTRDRKIISYGSVGTNFETKYHIGGTARTFNRNLNLTGYVFEYDEIIYGVIQYNTSALAGKTAGAICTDYANTYRTNPTKYLRGIAEQSVTFFNAISHFIGNDANLVFDERMFYTNEQFKEFGSSVRLYLQAMSKSSEFMRGIGVKEGISLAQRNNAYLLNPLQIGSLASVNPYINYGNKNIAVFDYIEEQNLITAVTVSPDCFEKAKVVNLTADEVEKLNAGRYEYQNAINNLRAESAIYEINPVEKPASISGLVAGKLKYSKKQGITDYVNAIRVAAGLPKLNLNEDCFNTAQHISTLMTYRWQVLGLDIKHQPAKDTLPGIDPTYYDIAVGWGKGYQENLGRSSTQTTVNSMMNHIGIFLDDTSEQGLFFSHRQKIMHADFTEFGYGISTEMFANEFSGYNDNDVYLEAWPANGITFLEAVNNKNKIYWTAQFTDKYKFLDTTDAKITCLNTGDVWEFTDAVSTNSKRYSIQTDNISSLNNRVIMYDSGIKPHEGYVYEVKFTGIQDVATGKLVDYSYRSAFEYADLDSYPSQSNEIDINEEKIGLAKVEGTDMYYLPIGEDVKLFAALNNSVTDKKVTWTSSDPTVTVTQNGIVHAHDKGNLNPVTISVTYDATSITSSVTFKPYTKINEVVIEPNKATITKGQSTDLLVKKLPSDATEKAQFTWYVVSNSDVTKKYAYNDPAITKYIKLEPYADNKLKAKITAVDAEMNNNKYTIRVEVEGVSGNTYTGECDIDIVVPLESIRISIKTAGIEMLQSSKTIEVDLNKNNIDVLELKTKPNPVNITGAANAKWTANNTTVLNFTSEYLEGKESIGVFDIVSEGETNVTAEVDGKTDTIKVIIRATLESLTINDTPEKVVALNETYKLPYSRVPQKDADKLYFASTNESVITIDDNGEMKFVGPGKATITVSNEEINPNTKLAKSGSICKAITYNVKIKAEKIELINPGINSYDVKV